MLIKRPILFLPLLFLLFGCGTEIKRVLEQREPVFSVGEPDRDEGLQISIADKVDDLGEHHLQLGIGLKNVRDSSGRTWSDVLGSSFAVQISNQKIPLKLEKVTDDQKPEEQEFKYTPSDSLDFAQVFGKSLVLANDSGDPRSSTAPFPVSLTNLSEKFIPFEQRILSNCRSDPSDVASGLRWNGRNDEALSLTGGEGQEFKTSLPDTGYWQASRDFFEIFFGKAGGAANQTSIPFYFKRTSSSPLKVTSNDHIDRSMLVTIRVDLELRYNLRYIENCKDL